MKSQVETLKAENEKLKSVLELATKISHEMNQPLTGIAGYCDLIAEQLDPDNPLSRDIAQIRKQAERLEKLVNRFQSVAIIETGGWSEPHAG